MRYLHRAVRGRAGAAGIAAALLFGTAACGSSDSGDSTKGPGNSASVPARSGSHPSQWENACAVHDVEAVKEFMGIRAFGVEPGSGKPGGGFSTNVVACDVTAFDMPLWDRMTADGATESDDSLAGHMYLRVQYSVTPESFADVQRQARNQWAAEGSTVRGRHLINERTLTGDWDEGWLLLGSEASDTNHGDRIVMGSVREGGWSVSCEIVYDGDPVSWQKNQPERVYKFTDEELAAWVGNTYLPQVYAAVVAALAAG